jgi:hypothetical protein
MAGAPAACRRRAAAVLVIGLCALLAGLTAPLAQPAPADAALPPVRVPSLQLPGVQTPPIQLPGVQVPSVQIPPPPDVGNLANGVVEGVTGGVVESVSGGGGPVQQVGGAVEDVVGSSPPSGATPGPGPGPTGDEPSSVPSAGATAGGGSSTLRQAAGVSPGAGGSRGAGGTLTAAPGGGSTRAAAFASARSPQHTRRVYERRLRSSVVRLQGCFYALSGLEHRVLSLRAGERRSRPAVAKRLGLATARVGRAERSGLRSLRRADRATGCSAAAAIALGGAGTAIARGVPREGATGLFGAGDATPGGTGAGEGAVAGRRTAGPSPAPGRLPTAAGIGGASGDGAPPVILLALLALAGTAILLVRRRRV